MGGFFTSIDYQHVSKIFKNKSKNIWKYENILGSLWSNKS